MKFIRVLMFGLLVFGVRAQEPAKDAKIERLLLLMDFDATMGLAFNQMKNAAAQAPPGATPAERAKVKQFQDKILIS